MSTEIKGFIAKVFEACCGNCRKWENIQAETTMQARLAAMKSGWLYTQDKGWLCGLCAEKVVKGGAR